jgi:hypothetical protein
MSYLSGGPTRAVASLLALIALGTAPHGRAAPKRQPVTLALSIDAKPYRRRLNDMSCASTCRQLQTRLADSVRAMLQRSYAFFDWAGAAPQDTVVMRWVDAPPTELGFTQLDFRIAGPVPRMRKQSLSLEFDRYPQLSERDAVPSRWSPDSLQKEWLGRLASTLLEPDVLVTVFGRIPIIATAKFPSPGLAEVAVLPEDIGAAANSRPVFSLHTTIRDQVSAGTATNDDAELILHKCKTNLTKKGFVCEIAAANYESDRVTGQKLLQLLGRAVITVKSVHVVEFVSEGRTSRFAGTLPAEGLP